MQVLFKPWQVVLATVQTDSYIAEDMHSHPDIQINSYKHTIVFYIVFHWNIINNIGGQSKRKVQHVAYNSWTYLLESIRTTSWDVSSPFQDHNTT